MDLGVVLVPGVLVVVLAPAGAVVIRWLVPGGETAIVLVEPPQPTAAIQAMRGAMDNARAGLNMLSGVWLLLRVLFS